MAYLMHLAFSQGFHSRLPEALVYSELSLLYFPGEPVVIKNAVCMHEEDDGMSWKHTDM